MINSWNASLLSLVALALVVPAASAAPRHRTHRGRHAVRSHHAGRKHYASYSAAENGLIGIHLFDSEERVIAKFGSPDDIQPLTFGTSQQGGGFGGGGFGGAPSAGPGGGGGMGPSRGPGGGGGGAMSPADYRGPNGADLESQFQFGDSMLQMPMGMGKGGRGMMPGGQPGQSGMPGPMGPGGAPGGPPGGFPGGFPGAPGGRGGAPMGGGAPGGGGSTESVTYTRWIYNRSNNKFAFVVNREGQIIQIEAIGLSNPSVKTRRGIGFGSHFANIVRSYHNPDGYEIGGDNILVKYLVHDKVAFRLTRIGDKQPHQVTAIVVSAGKG